MSTTFAELVFIPAPGVGHIMSTIEIAKLLVNRDHHLSVTVLIIKPPNPAAGSAITTFIESLAENASNRISFIELPQPETLPTRDSKAPEVFFNEFITSHCDHVRNIVADMINRPGPGPGSGPGPGRVAGFVIDMFCTSMIDVANEFSIPSYVFFTSNAAFLGFYLYIQVLCEAEKQDVVKVSNSNTRITVPCFVEPVPGNVFWHVLRTREGLDYVLSSARKLRAVKAIMVNSFLELETHAVKVMSDDITMPPVYPVGPILNLSGGGGKRLDETVMKWLDSQPSSSVVFLCFGSMGSFDEVQVTEIARALEQSGHRFLWSLRRPPSDKSAIVPMDYEDPGVVLPEGFLDRTAGMGKVIGWAPQVTVLAHPAVGGFVSHCGWNSLLESLWFGVPVATWPMYAEQQMNAFHMVVELGLAAEIRIDYKTGDNVVVTASEIEIGVRRVMEDDDLRAKVKAISKTSRAAVMEGGSSFASVDRLVRDFKQNIL